MGRAMNDENARRVPMMGPTGTAAALAGLYTIVCAAYIRVSSFLAARAARDVAALERIEMVKGYAFFLVSGVAIFFVARYMLVRIARSEAEIRRQRGMLVATERRAAAGMFASSTARDINTILKQIGAGIEELDVRTLSGPQREALGRFSVALGEIRRLAERLAAVGRWSLSSATERFDTAAAIERVVELSRQHAETAACSVRAVGGMGAVIVGNQELFEQALFNLILNAAQATGPGGIIEIRVAETDADIVVGVHDNGPGVPPEAIDRIFEPFHTTRSGGYGLGLVAVKACAEVHRGSVTVGPSPLGGACFRIAVPMTKSA